MSVDPSPRAVAKSMGFRDLMGWVMALRTTGIDRLIEMAIAAGADTVLNLGAGLDTRPYRLSLPKSLRWIEVDLEPIVQMKEARLGGEAARCQIERCAFDLANEAERRTFLKRSLVMSHRAIVLTEGLIPYLTPLQVSALAEELTAIPAVSWWIQDYMDGGFGRGSWVARRRLRAAELHFFVDDWFQFFSVRNWYPERVITVEEEEQRTGRFCPLPFPWRAIPGFARRSKRLRHKRQHSGYVLLGRGDSSS